MKNKNRFFWINERQAKFTFIEEIPNQAKAKASDWKEFNERNLMHMAFYGEELLPAEFARQKKFIFNTFIFPYVAISQEIAEMESNALVEC